MNNAGTATPGTDKGKVSRDNKYFRIGGAIFITVLYQWIFLFFEPVLRV